MNEPEYKIGDKVTIDYDVNGRRVLEDGEIVNFIEKQGIARQYIIITNGGKKYTLFPRDFKKQNTIGGKRRRKTKGRNKNGKKRRYTRKH